MKIQFQNKKLFKAIAIAIWIVVIVMLVFLFMLLFGKNNSNDIDRFGEKLFGKYTLYQDKVYVSVPSNGDYGIDVDIPTFKALNDEYKNKHIALDKNNVYCGNIILPNLNPLFTKDLGNNYYTDGTLTYFCAPYTISNDSITWYQEIWQEFQYQFFDKNKPQTYYYPFEILPKSQKPYYAIDSIRFIATNGDLVYHKGKKLSDANPATIRSLKKYNDSDDYRESFQYFADDKNVYFNNLKLPISSNTSLYSINTESQRTKEFLYNPLDSMVYIDSISFDRENAPYKLVSFYGGHADHTLFLSKNGVYFYNSTQKEVQRAGNNPFYQKNFREIAPLVFSNSKQTLFIDTDEHWVRRYRRGNSKRLSSISTYINQLDEGTSSNWEKIGKIRSGTIWQNGHQYFYFDEYGETQLIFNTIYKIANEKTAQAILKDQLNSKEIRDLIKSEQLIPAKYKTIVKAKTNYRNEENVFMKYIWLILIIIGVSGQLFYKLKEKGIFEKYMIKRKYRR